MGFFKNKHVITAMIVAPILAVLAFFAVDLLVKEKPHVAQAGQAYPLVAQSNCRFTSGECVLANASFSSKLTISRDQQTSENVLQLSSSHALQNATIGFVDKDGNEISPAVMRQLDDTQKNWQLALPIATSGDTLARVALKANDSFYFAETTMQFSDYQTSFDKDFRKEN